MDTLKKRFKHMPEIRRMNHEKKLPKAVKKAVALQHIQKTSERRKIDNRKRHSKPDSADALLQPERKRAVLKQVL